MAGEKMERQMMAYGAIASNLIIAFIKYVVALLTGYSCYRRKAT